MIKMNILKARISRNHLVELAREAYRDTESGFIKKLQQDGKEAILGIERKDGVYTALGKDFTYYSMEDGSEGKISHESLLKILSASASREWKTKEFEFVKVKNTLVWFINPQVLCAMWNTILYLHSCKS